MSGSNHVYVRDRKSLNGTYVNDQLIGAGSQISSGFLLDDGDVIEIRPHWRFVFKQAGLIMRHDLTETQKAECRVFHILTAF
jgi:calcium/calmodulin-dependent protein kinase I